MADQIFFLLILSLAVASVAWTVTQEKIFAEVREYFSVRSTNSPDTFTRKFYYVFVCEYCFSHWVTIGFLLLSGFRLLIDDWRGYILAFFVIPWLANQWMSLYRRLRLEIKQGKAEAEEKERK